MKKLLAAAAALVLLTGACTSSDDKSTWEEYTEWRNTNNAWLAQQQQRTNPDGTPYFKTVIPPWNTGSFVLMHYFNNRAETEGNLSPIYTSTVDVRYYVHLYDNTPVDSSVNATGAGKSGIYRSMLNNLIPGWAVALSDMRCGDTAEVVIPYQLAYGEQSMGAMYPYSNLRFNIRLVDVYKYEATPY